MKRTFITFISLIFLILTSSTQAQEKSLLWEISGNGLENPSYLYGTFHLLCPDDLDIGSEVKEALASCNELVLELDFDDPNLMMAMQQGMMFTDGTTAKDYLNEEEYALVADFFTSNMGLPFEQLAGIKPFFLSAMTILPAMGCQPVSVEQQLSSLAGENGFGISGLETVEEQIGFIDDIPLEDAAEMLVTSIGESDEAKEMNEEMVSTYLAGDLEGIQEIIDEHLGDEYAEINEDLIVKRNEDWVPKIGELVSGGPTFIAFGAGHLPGPNGVISLLRAAGYKVKAVH